MQDLLNVGIDSIGFYAPRFYIELEELALARNVPPDKYKEGLLLKELRFTDSNEDVISLGFNAARIALQRGNINPHDIDGVFVGTETETYGAKSVSNIFTELLEISPNCLTQDIMNTCASGTLATLDAISLVELGVVTKALVIITDISSYEKQSKGEPTQGAGAVALVISKNPRIASFSKSFGKVSGNVDDFFRPKGQKHAQVFGKYSVKSYLNLQMKAYENLEKQIGDINADYFIFHGPYARLPLKLMYKLISKNWLYRIEKKISKYSRFPKPKTLDRIFSKISILPDFIVDKLAELTSNSEEIESVKMRLRDVIKNTVLPQLHIPMYFGNMYSASLWAQLQYLLETSLKPNDFIYFGSYGSGATCISGLIRINERFNEVIQHPPTVRDIMKQKVKKSIPEYENIKLNLLKPELVWGKITSLDTNPSYTLRYCDNGCLLSPIQGIDYCPKGHKGMNIINFPSSAKVESIVKPFETKDFSPLKEGFVLIIGNPEIGSTVQFGLRRTQVNEEDSEAPGLLNWIPIIMPITDYTPIFPQLKRDYEELLDYLSQLGYEIHPLPVQRQADEIKGEAFASAYPIQGLLKYHGMVDSKVRIAMFPSISLNNGAFQTISYVKFDTKLSWDKFVLDGNEKSDSELSRVQYQLQQIRNYTNVSSHALVISRNISNSDIKEPITAKGIGTSAAGGAAIAKAAFSILYRDPKISENPRLLSIFSRYLSGSATRSSVGGISLWLNHPTCDTWDSYALRLDKSEDKDFINNLSLITIPMQSAITTSSAHKIATQSPLYKNWCLSRKEKILDFLKAFTNHNFDKIGSLAEEDSKMLHEIHVTSPKGESYWSEITRQIVKFTENMRENDIPIYYSIDTGPSVVLMTYKKYQKEITEALTHSFKTPLPIITGSIKGPSTLITKKPNLLHLLDDDIEKFST